MQPPDYRYGYGAILNWLTLLCILIYWVAIFANLRNASTADLRRRLRVLCAGSVVGLGSTLIVWGLLPRFGVDPAGIEWLGYSAAVLMLVFPFSLVYVVVVQRSLDINILMRMGTRYILARTTVFLIQFAVITLLLFRVVIPLLQRKNENALVILLPIFVLAFLFRVQFVKRGVGDRAK